jgi:TatD DNase family protein
LVDSHTHLDMCEPDDSSLVEAAGSAGVTRIVTVGTTPERCRLALESASRFEGVFAAIGRHPNSASGFSVAEVDELRELASGERCVAIGETGLDYYREYAPVDDQKQWFAAQIALARELDKPLVIHTRAAEDDTLALLSSLADGVRVILHCFTMSGRLDECLAHPDWYVSFAGNVTYPSAGDLRAAAVRVPLDRLLVETDAPFLSPQPVRGKRNQPAFVVHTAQALAVERRVSYEELSAALERNAAALFGW